METKQENSQALAQELDFFGRVTASATHQIKNELAVINETAYLVVEILAMAQQGREIDPERIKALGERVVARVENANQVVKKLNTFAHSAEAETAGADPARALELMVHFYQRLAKLKGVSLILETGAADEASPVQLKPFEAEQAVWRAMEAMVEVAENGTEIKLSLKRTGSAVQVVMTGRLTGQPQLERPGLSDLVEVGFRAETGSLILEFPV